jgi:hypothetical protein
LARIFKDGILIRKAGTKEGRGGEALQIIHLALDMANWRSQRRAETWEDFKLEISDFRGGV